VKRLVILSPLKPKSRLESTPTNEDLFVGTPEWAPEKKYADPENKGLTARAQGSGHRAQEKRKAQPMWDTRKNKADLVNKGLSKR
jgi:hypothetical protein